MKNYYKLNKIIILEKAMTVIGYFWFFIIITWVADIINWNIFFNIFPKPVIFILLLTCFCTITALEDLILKLADAIRSGRDRNKFK